MGNGPARPLAFTPSIANLRKTGASGAPRPNSSASMRGPPPPIGKKPPIPPPTSRKPSSLQQPPSAAPPPPSAAAPRPPPPPSSSAPHRHLYQLQAHHRRLLCHRQTLLLPPLFPKPVLQDHRLMDQVDHNLLLLHLLYHLQPMELARASPCRQLFVLLDRLPQQQLHPLRLHPMGHPQVIHIIRLRPLHPHHPLQAQRLHHQARDQLHSL